MPSSNIYNSNKEQEYHDRAFKEMIREGQGKFYSVASRCFDYYRGEIIDHCKGKKILELGCGPESLAHLLASKDAFVTGIDISPVAIQMSIKKISGQNDKISLMQMDAHNMVFGDNSFDIVCGSGILHHLDIEAACLEILRVLKPGGKAVFLEPLGHNPFINAYRQLTPNMRTEDEHPLKNSDIHKMANIFGNISTMNFNLTTLLAVPLRRMPIFVSVLNILSNIDSFLFKMIPILKSWSWMIVVTARK